MSYWTIFALIALILFGIANFLLKYATTRGASCIPSIMVVLAVAGLIGLLGLVLNHKSISSVDGYKYSIIAGIFFALGMIFMNIAIVRGKTGPAVAIASSNVLVVAILAWLILGERLSRSDLLGIILFLLALIVLALRPLG